MLLAYLKRQYKLLLLLAGAVCIFAAVFALYDLPLEAVPGDCWRRTIRRCCRQSAGTGPGWRRRMKAASGS